MADEAAILRHLRRAVFVHKTMTREAALRYLDWQGIERAKLDHEPEEQPAHG